MTTLILSTLPVALAACADDPCLGVDGTCVALTVEAMDPKASEVDGLDISVSGASIGRRVVPPVAAVNALPLRVALKLSAVKAGTLHIEVVGVRFGADVGAGSTDIEVASGQSATAKVTLGSSPVRTCRDPSRPVSCPDAGCWPEGTDCASLVTCGGAPRACEAGATGHCSTDAKFFCCAEDHPVFCQVSVPGCTGCWTAGATCTGAMLVCPDGTCHSCATGTFDCVSKTCR